jgi:hypothetical protein
MLGKSNLPSEAAGHNGAHGSSLDHYPSVLDQERAASMADEGGVAGAIMDTREQHAAARRAREPAAARAWLQRGPRAARPDWIFWGAIAAGCAVLVGSLIVGYRRL